MKRLICVFLVALLMIGLLPGCSAEEDKPVSSANADNITDNSAVEENAVVESKEPEKITIEEAVVYDKDGVKITVSGMEDGWTGPEVKFLIENATDKNIAISGDTAIINGVTIPVYLYIDVAAGKKTIDTMTIYTSNLEIAGIEKIATINVKDAHIVDTDSYNTLADAPFEIVTSVGTDYVQEVDDSGEVLFEANGISVIGKVFKDSLFGEEVILLVKNNSEKNVTVQAENISVNGFTIDGWMYDTVYSGTVRFCSLGLYSTSLEENEITKVEDVCFTINLIDPNSFSRLAQSDEIQIIVNE